MVSTDALYFAVGRYGFAGGIMITASHNPANYNGMKFTRDRAQAISLDTGLGALRDRLARGDVGPLGERLGKLEQMCIRDRSDPARSASAPLRIRVIVRLLTCRPATPPNAPGHHAAIWGRNSSVLRFVDDLGLDA